ncbi:MAG: NusG domain II-containing protein [Halanaerobiaceae bacterium]
MKSLWHFMTIYDKILIVTIIILSIVAIIYPVGSLLYGNNANEGEQVIVIKSQGEEQKRVPMETTYGEEPVIIKAEGPLGTSIIEAYQGKVRLREAPPEDPEKICEKTGWIEQTGPIIICVPNQVSIWIERVNSELDGVSW